MDIELEVGKRHIVSNSSGYVTIEHRNFGSCAYFPILENMMKKMLFLQKSMFLMQQKQKNIVNIPRMIKQKIKERDIIAGCKADKPQSQRQLYDKYCRLVMGIALRYTKCQTDAEDIVQETFIKIFMKINSLRDENSLTTWIKTITTNTCLDFLKAQNNDFVMTSINETTDDIKDEYNKQYDDIPTEQLLSFIQELPDGYRTVFNLYAIDGYKYEEVAQMLGCSASNVRSQYFRARKLLKEKIESYE